MREHGRCGECDVVADILHAVSQPLTALEVGLEISLQQDRDVAQLRSRVESALTIAQAMHERLVDIRRELEANDRTSMIDRMPQPVNCRTD
jgi:hypothetical protein